MPKKAVAVVGKRSTRGNIDEEGAKNEVLPAAPQETKLVGKAKVRPHKESGVDEALKQCSCVGLHNKNDAPEVPLAIDSIIYNQLQTERTWLPY